MNTNRFQSELALGLAFASSLLVSCVAEPAHIPDKRSTAEVTPAKQAGELLTPLPRLEGGAYRCSDWTLEPHEATRNLLLRFVGDPQRAEVLLACSSDVKAYPLGRDLALVVSRFSGAPREDGTWLRVQVWKRGGRDLFRYDLAQVTQSEGVSAPRAMAVTFEVESQRVLLVLGDVGRETFHPRVLELDLARGCVSSDVAGDGWWGYQLRSQPRLELVSAREVIEDRYIALGWAREGGNASELAALTLIPKASSREPVLHVLAESERARTLDGSRAVFVPGTSFTIEVGRDASALDGLAISNAAHESFYLRVPLTATDDCVLEPAGR